MIRKFAFRFGVILVLLLVPVIGRASPQAHVDSPIRAPTSSSNDSRAGQNHLRALLGGYIKARGSVSWPDDDSYYRLVAIDPYYDGTVEFRSIAQLFFDQWGYFEVQYEAVLLGGDTWRRGEKAARLFPNLFFYHGFGISPLEDDRRFLDLSKTVHRSDSSLLYHRVDRLFLSLLFRGSILRIGRQAVTWGNGLIFNPMDLFNPFAPTDIERDYKVGDDMVLSEFSIGGRSDVQLLSVCRRDPTHRTVRWSQSSLAGKAHFAIGMTEFDVMGGKNYEDYVVGVGSTAYLKDAACRIDASWTFLKGKNNLGGFLSLVTNVDYSWIWWDRNIYGFLEFYYSGVGEARKDYSNALTDPYISERVTRGELFVLGRFYLAGGLTVELHPLFTVYLTVINNVADPSGVVQPRAIYDLAEDLQITLGFNLLYGSTNTEYGGFPLADTDYLFQAPDSAYLWISYYF